MASYEQELVSLVEHWRDAGELKLLEGEAILDDIRRFLNVGNGLPPRERREIRERLRVNRREFNKIFRQYQKHAKRLNKYRDRKRRGLV